MGGRFWGPAGEGTFSTYRKVVGCVILVQGVELCVDEGGHGR